MAYLGGTLTGGKSAAAVNSTVKLGRKAKAIELVAGRGHAAGVNVAARAHR